MPDANLEFLKDLTAHTNELRVVQAAAQKAWGTELRQLRYTTMGFTALAGLLAAGLGITLGKSLGKGR